MRGCGILLALTTGVLGVFCTPLWLLTIGGILMACLAPGAPNTVVIDRQGRAINKPQSTSLGTLLVLVILGAAGVVSYRSMSETRSQTTKGAESSQATGTDDARPSKAAEPADMPPPKVVVIEKFVLVNWRRDDSVIRQPAPAPAREGAVLYGLSVEIENHGYESVAVNPVFFELDAGGQAAQSSVPTVVPRVETKRIGLGEKSSGSLVFVVVKPSKLPTLTFRPVSDMVVRYCDLDAVRRKKEAEERAEVARRVQERKAEEARRKEVKRLEKEAERREREEAEKRWKDAHPDPSAFLAAEGLVEEYDGNEVAADRNYKGQCVQVTGKIASIGRDITNSAFVTLEGPSGTFRKVQCVFEPEFDSALASLSKGQTVSIVGKCSGLLGNVHLHDCWFPSK